MAFKKSGGSGSGNGEDFIPNEDVIDALEGAESVTPASSVTPSENTGEAPTEEVDALPVEEVASTKTKPDEEEELESTAQSMSDVLLSGGGMELSDEGIELSPTSVDSVSGASPEAPASAENVSESVEASSLDETVSNGGPARLERIIGNGNPLSPNAQRKAALDEKAAASQGYGGGGGIGSLFAAAGSGVKSVLNGVGSGIMRVGGQKLADRFIEPTDPISVAKRLQRQRYAAFNRALKGMETATKERASSVEKFNELVSNSAPGRTLSEMADASGASLHDFMSDVKSGKNRDVLAVKCMEALERDATFGQAAKKISTAEAAFVDAEKLAEVNFKRLASDHAAEINVGVENNRLVDAFEAAETDVKKPLPLEASLKDGQTGSENKIDTEKQHKKFMEALEKIKESIAALLQKIMSKLGMGGPK